MSDKLAVLMEFNGYTKDELEAYLSLKFGSMTKGGMTASILSQSGYEKAKSVIFDQPQLDENQQVVLDWLKNRYTGNADPFGVAACLFSQTPRSEVIVATLKLTRDEQAQVLKIFVNWTLEQEEE